MEFPVVVTDGKGRDVFAYVRQLFLPPPVGGSNENETGDCVQFSLCVIGSV